MTHHSHEIPSAEMPASQEEVERLSRLVAAIWSAVDNGQTIRGMETSTDGVFVRARRDHTDGAITGVVLYQDYDGIWIVNQEIFVPNRGNAPINSVNRTTRIYPLSLARTPSMMLETGVIEDDRFRPTEELSRTELGPLSTGDCQEVKQALGNLFIF